MKAAYVNNPGPAESIVYGELPDPKPSDTQVLVKVGAVAVNPIDTYIRSGMVAMDLPRPFVIGCDLAGTVVAVGSHTKQFNVGDRVWGSNQGLLGRQGTFAEFAAVEEQWLYRTPDTVSDQDASAIALVGIISHLGLVSYAKVRPAENVLVNGGSGGIGSMVIQIARVLGARICATAGTDEKVAICRDLGAEVAINYQTDDVPSQIRSFCPSGVDIWWETVREPDFDRSIGCLAERGRLVLMAGRDARPEFPVGPFYVKGCTLYGLVMFQATPAEQRQAAEDINLWLETGQLKPRIDRVLSLSDAAYAHHLQEANTLGKAGTLAGKIVLVP